jgi:hypothetical protein
MKATLLKLTTMLLCLAFGLAIEGAFLLFAGPDAPESCNQVLLPMIWDLVHLPVSALFPMDRDADFLIVAAVYAVGWAALFYAILFQPVRNARA